MDGKQENLKIEKMSKGEKGKVSSKNEDNEEKSMNKAKNNLLFKF